MTSANDLDTLRAAIATAVGWRDLNSRRQWVETWYDTYEDEQLFGIAPDGKARMVPDWPHDTDDALALWTGVQWELSYLPTPAEHKPYTFIAFPESGAVGADGETSAEAVARAWLEYTKHKQETTHE